MAAIDLLTGAIRYHLHRKRAAINDAIGSYPTPIAAGDQQFNYLLEQRDALKRALADLDALDMDGLTGVDAVAALTEFIRTCRGLDAEAKAALTDRLRDHPTTGQPV